MDSVTKPIYQWWIVTDKLSRGGLKVSGPFETAEIAIKARTALEHKNEMQGGRVRWQTYWVDKERITKDTLDNNPAPPKGD